jgi:hypothetical protein
MYSILESITRYIIMCAKRMTGRPMSRIARFLAAGLAMREGVMIFVFVVNVKT